MVRPEGRTAFVTRASRGAGRALGNVVTETAAQSGRSHAGTALGSRLGPDGAERVVRALTLTGTVLVALAAHGRGSVEADADPGSATAESDGARRAGDGRLARSVAGLAAYQRNRDVVERVVRDVTAATALLGMLRERRPPAREGRAGPGAGQGC